MKRAAGPGLALNLPGDVEQARIHFGRLVKPPVPQGPVELVERLADIAAITPERDGREFLGVHVLDADAARVAIGNGILSGTGADHEHADRHGGNLQHLERMPASHVERAAVSDQRHVHDP